MSTASDPRTLLRRRAVTLAKRPVEEETSATIDLLVATVEGRRLGFEGGRVLQILPNRGMCHLPTECGELLGLVSSRGALVPVADLGSLVGAATPNRERAFIVLVEGDAPAVGLLVDDVSSVLRIPAHEVRRRPTETTGPTLERGLTPTGVVVLDTALLLEDPRLTPQPDQDHTPDAVPPRPDPTPGEPCPT